MLGSVLELRKKVQLPRASIQRRVYRAFLHRRVGCSMARRLYTTYFFFFFFQKNRKALRLRECESSLAETSRIRRNERVVRAQEVGKVLCI